MNFILNINKNILILLAFMVMGSYTYAQSIDNYKSKHEGWLVSMDEAYKLSKETGKPIMANFTGVNWCPYCVKLHRAVFAKEKFKTWAKENVILLELDFPRKEKNKKRVPIEIQQQNQSLQNVFKVNGFPTIWVFDLDKKDNQYSISAYGKTGYTKSAEQFISDVDNMLKNKG